MSKENKVKDKNPTKDELKIQSQENIIKSLEQQIGILKQTANTLMTNIQSVARDFAIISNSVPNLQEHLQILLNNIRQNKILTERKVS